MSSFPLPPPAFCTCRQRPMGSFSSLRMRVCDRGCIWAGVALHFQLFLWVTCTFYSYNSWGDYRPAACSVSNNANK